MKNGGSGQPDPPFVLNETLERLVALVEANRWGPREPKSILVYQAARQRICTTGEK
jgi:hypothetical protein